MRLCRSAGSSFVNVLRYDSGFDASNILTGNTLIGGQPYDAQERHIRSFVDQLLPRLHALPGVEAAAVASALPLEPTFANSAITFEGVPLPPIGTWPTMLILRSLPYWKMTGHTRITMPRPQNPNVRKRLMAAGQQLFLTQGFNGCGVQEITSAAEVPKGSFYSYFETKEAFALAVLEEFWIGVEKKFGGILRDAALKPVERVARYFKALSDDKARHNYAHGCLIGNFSLEMTDVSADTRAKLSDIFERWENPIITCLREAQSKKEIAANHDLRDLAASIIESWEGAVMRAKVEQRRSAYRRFEEIVLPSLLKR